MPLLRGYHAEKQLPKLFISLNKIEFSVIQGPDISKALNHAEEDLRRSMQINISSDFPGNNALREKILQGIDIFVNNVCHLVVKHFISQGDNLRDYCKGKTASLFNGRKVSPH